MNPTVLSTSILQKIRTPFCFAVLAGGVSCYLGAVVLAGGSLWELFLFWAAFGLCILAGGRAVLRLLHIPVFGSDRLVLSFLPGCTLVFLSYVLMCCLLGAPAEVSLPGFVYLLPACAAGLFELFLLNRSAEPYHTAHPTHKGTFYTLLACIGILFALYALWGVLPFAQADRLKAWSYHQDMLWSIGNAAAMQFGLPLHDMRAAGLTLNYHFFNDGIAGILSLAVGCTAWHGLCFYWYAPVLALSAVGLYRTAKLFFASDRLAVCTVPLLYLCNPAASTMATNLFTNTNAQGSALLALFGLIILLFHLPDEKSLGNWLSAAVCSYLCFFTACMLKSPSGTLAVLALAAACIVGIFTRQTHACHWAALLGAAGAFLTIYLLILRHATNNLIFTSLANICLLPKTYLLYFCLPLLVLYLISLGHSLMHFTALPLPVLTVNAFAIGGVLAYVLYNHYSFSQVYFALSAVPCAILAALPCTQALADLLTPRLSRAAAGLLAAALLLCSCQQLYVCQDYLRTGVQAALRCLNLRESQVTERTITDEDWAAALWLQENSPTDAVFLSNRNNKEFAAAEGVFHFYSAASQRQCYLESYRYAMDYDGAYHEIRRRLEQISDAIYYRLPEDQAFAAAAAEDVDYILVSLLVPDAPDWVRTPVFENQYVRIYTVN